MKIYKLRTVLFIFLISVIFSKPYWPQLFSRQDKIDPNKIENSYDNTENTAIFNNNEIAMPVDFLANKNEDSKVLGEYTGDKRIEVDLTKQRMYAYSGENLIYSFFVSSGLWNRTPTGTFQVWTKIRSQKMSGGSKELGTYYYLPNVPYIMFFYNDKVAKKTGYSLHGTYWHRNFGVPMSHGCINMETSEIAQVYSWAEVGIPVIIYGKYEYKKVDLPKTI